MLDGLWKDVMDTVLVRLYDTQVEDSVIPQSLDGIMTLRAAAVELVKSNVGKDVRKDAVEGIEVGLLLVSVLPKRSAVIRLTNLWRYPIENGQYSFRIEGMVFSKSWL